jgi:hypothetical protein
MKIKQVKKCPEIQTHSHKYDKMNFNNTKFSTLEVGVLWYLELFGQKSKLKNIFKLSFIYIVGKVFKCRYWKCVCILHLKTWNWSYEFFKNQETNSHLDFWSLKPRK